MARVSLGDRGPGTAVRRRYTSAPAHRRGQGGGQMGAVSPIQLVGEKE